VEKTIVGIGDGDRQGHNQRESIRVFTLSELPQTLQPVDDDPLRLPHRSGVQLTVFNTLGQQVALLQNEELDAGFHQVQFDPSGLSSACTSTG